MHSMPPSKLYKKYSGEIGKKKLQAKKVHVGALQWGTQAKKNVSLCHIDSFNGKR